MKRLFIIWLLIFIGMKTPAQTKLQSDYNFHNLSIKDGLSQSAVNCILQDKRGSMWFGTLDGLNKFDGYRFKQYKHRINDPKSISASAIYCISEDTDGKILIGTFGGGFSIFNPLFDEFTNYRNNPEDSLSLSSNEITGILHHKNSFYWISTFLNGLNLFDTITKKSIRISKDGSSLSLSSNNIRGMVRGNDGKIYIATRSGLNILDYDGRSIKQFYCNADDSTVIQDNKFQYISWDHKGRIWLGSRNGGVFMFNPKTEKFIQYKHEPNNKNSIASNYVNCVSEMADGMIWIGTFANGISILNPENDSIIHLSKTPADPYSLSSNQIINIYQGSSNIIWVGTNPGGVNYYHNSFNQFSLLRNIWGDIKTPDYNNVFSINQDSSKIWIGSGGAGLYSYDIANRTMSSMTNSPDNQNSISYNHIWSLVNLNEDTLIIGTYGKGFNILDKRSGKIARFKNDSLNTNTLSSDQILCMTMANDSQLWIGTNATGISIFNLKDRTFRHLKNDPSNSQTLGANFILSIYKSRDGTQYIGTNEKGLDVLENNSDNFIHYRNNPSDSFSISNNSIYCIYEDDHGIIWLGTMGGGLNAFDRKSKHFIHYTEQDGLPNNVIYGICGDKHDNLWLSTNNGICKFTPPELINFNSAISLNNKPRLIRNYNISDGLSSNEFNQGAYFQNNAGWIYFGSISGITCFHPDSIFDNTFKPPILLTSFKVFEKNYPLDTLIEYKKKIVLKYNQDFFSFEFAALNYLLPEKNQYAYKMEGFDRDWIYTGTRRYASFTNLNPGDYTFKVKASNNDGIWNENYASIQITITPPFWKTWWFKLLVAVASAAAVYVAFRLRVRAIQKEEKQKTAFHKALAEVEMKALRAQMNPHFIFNSLNSINKFIIAKDERIASGYLAKFSRLIRLVLENSMQQSIPLDKEIAALELYIQMEQLRFENGFEYSIEIDDTVETESVLIPPLLLQPFVENAIWHGLSHRETPGKISITIKVINQTLVCTIEDNGVGREKAREIKAKNKSAYKSLGMKVTHERIDLLKQQKNIVSEITFVDLKNEKGSPIGTRAEIKIPLEYNF